MDKVSISASLSTGDDTTSTSSLTDVQMAVAL